MKIINTFYKTIASLLIALGILLHVIQEDPWCKIMLENQFAFLMQSFDTQFSARITAFDILRFKIMLEDVWAQSPDGHAWSWGCTLATLQGSWWKLFRNKTIEISGEAQGFDVFSECSGMDIAIREHINTLFSSPFLLPVNINNFSIHHGTMRIAQENDKDIARFVYNSRSTMNGAKFKTALSLIRADMVAAQGLQNLSGYLECDIISRPTSIDVQTTGQFSFEIEGLSEEQNKFVLSLFAKDGSGYFDIHNDEHTLGGSVTRVGESLIARLSGSVPLSYLEAVVCHGSVPQAKGVMAVQAEADLYDLDNFIRITMCVEDPVFHVFDVKKITAHVKRNEGKYQSDMSMQVDKDNILNMHASYDPYNKSGHAECKGSIFDYIFTNSANEIKAVLAINQNDIAGSFALQQLDAENAPLMDAQICGDVVSSLKIKGSIEGNKYFSLEVENVSQLQQVKLYCSDEFEKTLVDFKSDYQACEATLDLFVLKALAKKVKDITIIGDGRFHFQAEKEANRYDGTVMFEGSGIRLPFLYNGVTKFDATWNATLAERKLTCTDVHVDLHKGSICAPHVTVAFDERGNISHVDAPFSVTDCFISHHKDFFAIFSGECSLQKDENQMSIQSNLCIDRSHLKGNPLAEQVHTDIFMPQFSNHMLNAATTFDISVATQEPLKIKTPFLQTNATINASVKGEFPGLEGAGTIEFKGGSLSFPYKPLYITHGIIRLNAHDLEDPEIELHAKNTIKKYSVAVLVTGTAKKPKISFYASPQLSEEQIITLLCTGSEDAGLLSAVPSVIMHNIQQLIFGPAEEISTFSKYVKKILRPFGSIRVVPTIGDTRDRTGLQASVEVDINERIHGSLRKNLSVSEDTKVELEYALSDEMSIRGTRDERGDVSAEVEFRFNL